MRGNEHEHDYDEASNVQKQTQANKRRANGTHLAAGERPPGHPVAVGTGRDGRRRRHHRQHQSQQQVGVEPEYQNQVDCLAIVVVVGVTVGRALNIRKSL